MKLLFCVLLLTFSLPAKAQSLTYKGVQILFPATVKDAYSRNQMGFKPPGWYYKTLADSVTFSLQYDYEFSDLYNERQPASALFEHKLTGYRFKFLDKPGFFGREKKLLEGLLGHSMRVTLEEGNSSVNYPAERRATMPNLGNFKMAEGKTKDGISVYLREVPRLSPKQKPLLQVFFIKGMEDINIKTRVHAMD
ncbi:hypothetical protein [Rudanella lutea]|uniref:hypothetical protein n=1 Tax=Rudanella lutea TaxID=451374 RepID=UPI00037A92E6|nr:hypothetical protein [Rudanella lutea]